jgi:acetyl-CoA synthetase
MENMLKEVGGRIRTLREIMDITQEDMAKRTNVTLSDYQALEEGKMDFSFTFIYKCAQHFHVDVTDILKGSSPTLTSYSVTRNGGGLPITRRKGFSYNNLAPMFKNKQAEPFRVKAPYLEEEQHQPIKLSTHEGQEFDVIISGQLKVQIDEHIEILGPGDSIYYNSSTPHGMIAVGGETCEFIAVVFHPQFKAYEYPENEEGVLVKKTQDEINSRVQSRDGIFNRFVDFTLDENNVLQEIHFKNEEEFNFAFDIVDGLAEKCPDKTAMLHVSREKQVRNFTFKDMSLYSSKTANYFKSLGIRKGDKVMLVLKRHYQFWFSIVIPATNLLVEHDFEYRFNAAGVKAIVATADGDVAHQVDLAAARCPELEIKMLVGGTREGWHDFDTEMEQCSDVFPRPSKEEGAFGSDLMLMFFTSGTTGCPKIAAHNHKYPLGHFTTAKFWHNVNPDGLHFTISDTGWGKALWGKLYGQWMCEAPVFTYDFDKFDANDILPMFKEFHITTFCAPPTMFRFFIKEDLSKFDLSSLEYACVAGEALNPEVYQQFLKATGVKLMEGFGQTETTLAIYNPIGTTPKPGSMGVPNPLFDVDIVDPDGKPVAQGETGEIVIHTDKHIPCGLFCGYYRDEEKTKEAWHDGLYHTGDTAWRDEDGYIWYVGRVDDVIKSSGYRIGPFEIESVIMELPYVLECAITAAPDPIRGQVVKATIVLVKGKEASDELKKEIQNYVKKHTAPYKYPRIVEFVDELPKTISGKIKRAEIRKQG